MTVEELTPTQRIVYDHIADAAPDGIRPTELAALMGYIGSDGEPNPTTVYDHVASIRKAGVGIGRTTEGGYVPLTIKTDTSGVLNVSAPSRQSPKTKAAITRAVTELMVEIEAEVKAAREAAGPVIATDGGIYAGHGEYEVIIPCSDDHYGDRVTNYSGEVVFDTEIVTARIFEKFEKAIDQVNLRKSLGFEIRSVVVPMNGDHVTNEALYESQPWHLDHGADYEAHIRGQLKAATETYGAVLQRLSAEFEHVTVPCQSGNHGEFRVPGASDAANADDLLFDRLELFCHAAGLDNITFIRSDRADAVNFPILGGRENGGWTGHMRHGQNVPVHIGTSSPLNKWKSHLDRYAFDVGFRGHYHEHRMEPVLGRPVYEIPSLKPGGDYEAKLAVDSAPMGFMLGVSKSELPAWIDYIHYDDPASDQKVSDFRPEGVVS